MERSKEEEKEDKGGMSWVTGEVAEHSVDYVFVESKMRKWPNEKLVPSAAIQKFRLNMIMRELARVLVAWKSTQPNV